MAKKKVARETTKWRHSEAKGQSSEGASGGVL